MYNIYKCINSIFNSSAGSSLGEFWNMVAGFYQVIP